MIAAVDMSPSRSNGYCTTTGTFYPRPCVDAPPPGGPHPLAPGKSPVRPEADTQAWKLAPVRAPAQVRGVERNGPDLERAPCAA